MRLKQALIDIAMIIVLALRLPGAWVKERRKKHDS